MVLATQQFGTLGKVAENLAPTIHFLLIPMETSGKLQLLTSLGEDWLEHPSLDVFTPTSINSMISTKVRHVASENLPKPNTSTKIPNWEPSTTTVNLIL